MFLLIFLLEIVLARPTYSRRHRSLRRKLENAFTNFMQHYDSLAAADDDSANVIRDEELPDWMHHLRNQLNGKSLNEILIPGAHDAAMNTGGGHFQTQSLSIEGLLNAGVRFLDLRVRFNLDNEPITYHMGSSTIATTGIGDSILLREVMDQINRFLIAHTGEVVIVKIKPDIWLSEKREFEEAIMRAIPSALQYTLLTTHFPINQKYETLIQTQKRFVIIYEKTKHSTESKYKGLFWNKDKVFMYSKAPLASSYDKLIIRLGKRLPTTTETHCRIALFHWTLTGGNIRENTNQYLNNIEDLKNKITDFQTRGKRVNVVMMDFCEARKSLAIINMNIPPPILP